MPSKGEIYPIADVPKPSEREALTAALNAGAVSRWKKRWRVKQNIDHEYMVETTGEKRCPKAGEWYVSGAIPEGYRAEKDLSSPCMIARLVVVELCAVITRNVISRGGDS